MHRIKHLLAVACTASLGLTVHVADASAQPAAVQPSFDCSKSHNAVEKLICSNGALAMLDREAARLYGAARADAGANRHKLTQSQDAWLKRRNDCASSTDKERCIAEFYVRHIAMLLHNYPSTQNPKAGISVGPFTATCEGSSKPVTVTFVNSDPAYVHMTDGDVSVVLKQALSADGGRYEAQFPKGQARLWNKGNTAQIAFPGGKDMSCTLKPVSY